VASGASSAGPASGSKYGGFGSQDINKLGYYNKDQFGTGGAYDPYTRSQATETKPAETTDKKKEEKAVKKVESDDDDSSSSLDSDADSDDSDVKRKKEKRQKRLEKMAKKKEEERKQKEEADVSNQTS